MTVQDLDAAAELLKALAHATRLAILRALVDAERSVGDLEQASGVGQPGLSQQLAVLRKAGLVETRREHKLVFYRINQSRVRDLSALLDSFTGPATASREDAGRRGHRGGGGAAMFARVG